jgi:hypothetical protein
MVTPEFLSFLKKFSRVTTFFCGLDRTYLKNYFQQNNSTYELFLSMKEKFQRTTMLEYKQLFP